MKSPLLLLIFSFAMVVAYGQETSPSLPVQGEATSTISPTLQTYLDEQRALALERQALLAQGATPEQLDAWHKQNAARFQAQLERSKQLAAASVPQPMPILTDVTVPDNASQAQKDFLVNRATAYNASAQSYNQSLPTSSSLAQKGTHPLPVQGFSSSSAAQATTEPQSQEVLAIPSIQVPPNASPELRAFLTAKDQLMRDEFQVINQSANLDPAAQQQAIAQWHKTNAARFQQLQQLAVTLSKSVQSNPQTPSSP